MNEHIKNAILKGRVVLLFGAGASRGSLNRHRKEIPLGWEIAKILAIEAGLPFEDEELPDVYNAAKEVLGSDTDRVFEEHFKHCEPSPEYLELAKYPFQRVYTLNIDDAFERALNRNAKQYFNIKRRHDKITEPDQMFSTLDYIKLNGDVNYLSDGFIFSPQEYGAASADPPFWYEELARDFFKYTFIFIGTQLKEPLFNHQVQRYKSRSHSHELRSYVLVPNLTHIQKTSLAASNIHHLPGTLEDFVKWLKNEFNEIPTSKVLLRNSRPDLDFLSEEVEKYPELFKGITPVNRSSLSLLERPDQTSKIREFYKGYKPTWFDIMEDVPAKLKSLSTFYTQVIEENLFKPGKIYLLSGSAGCGKSTLLKQLALKIADEAQYNVYFIDDYNVNLMKVIQELDNRNDREYFVFIERFGEITIELSDVLRETEVTKAIFVGAENLRVWSHRVLEHLEEFLDYRLDVSHIHDSDATNILEKVRRYGNWTRLRKMSVKNRKIELLKKSKRQLLIGLIEATSGEGFDEIIKKDYFKIDSTAQKYLLLLTGLATSQRVPANENTLVRALANLGVEPNVPQLVTQMDGLIRSDHNGLFARHRVYVERLFYLYVNIEELAKVISAYIEAFTVYDSPVVRSISRSEAMIYRNLVNAKSLTKLLKKNEDLIFKVYKKFEKTFENDGLFLMQYGIALRYFKNHAEAYEKLRIANQAYPESPQIEHALAQQRIIMASLQTEETIAMAYFNQAEDVLKRLDRADIHIYDHYPIISLSEGHVRIFDKLGRKAEARKVAKEYYDLIRKKNNGFHNDRIKLTLTNLMKYHSTGKWMEVDEFDELEV